MNSNSNCPRENWLVSFVHWMPGVLRISLGLIITLDHAKPDHTSVKSNE